MNDTKQFHGNKVFSREKLKKIFFGKSSEGDWFLKTVLLDRDSLNVTVLESCISKETMQIIVNLYLGIDINSEIVRS